MGVSSRFAYTARHRTGTFVLFWGRQASISAGRLCRKSLTSTASKEVNVLAVSVLSAYDCDPSAALRFIGFTAVITAEARRTAEIRREDF
jgi:hypothetical protein